LKNFKFMLLALSCVFVMGCNENPQEKEAKKISNNMVPSSDNTLPCFKTAAGCTVKQLSESR